MKPKAICVGILLSIIFVFNSNAQQDDFPVLKGPYLGQKPPGMTPEVFAPDVITEPTHSTPVFSPDGSEVFWVPWSTLRMKTMKQINGVWTKPQTVSFALDYDAENPMFTADGNRLFFTSTRPLKAEGLKLKKKFGGQENIWYIDREQGDDWSEPVPLGPEVNSMDLHWQVSVDNRNNLYFSAKNGENRNDIFRSLFINSRYTSPEKLAKAINTKGDEDTPFISPDGNYLIFARKSGDDTFADLYISFYSQEGQLSNAISLGKKINTKFHEIYPHVTKDGKYLFFISTRTGKPCIYWVDARIIETHGVKGLNKKR